MLEAWKQEHDDMRPLISSVEVCLVAGIAMLYDDI